MNADTNPKIRADILSVKEMLIVIGGVCIVTLMFAASRFLLASIPPALLNPDVTEAHVVPKAENVSHPRPGPLRAERAAS